MQQLLDQLKEIGIGQVATVVGRYYAMDRDKRWERVEVGMNALCIGDGKESTDPVQSIKEAYEEDPRGDEFLEPIILGGQESRIKGDILSNASFQAVN
jgi:2,3-bisphosphoglycerate-independent phosphoglycerate mutase